MVENHPITTYPHPPPDYASDEKWRKLLSPQLRSRKLFQLTSDAIRMKLKFGQLRTSQQKSHLRRCPSRRRPVCHGESS